MATADKLTRREREIMDLIYAMGRATASEIQQQMSGTPGNTAVRTHLRILEEKGFLTHRQEGKRYIYRATQSKKRIGKSAFERVLKVYFGDSLQKAMAAHLSDPKAEISEEELDALDVMIRDAKKKRQQQ